MPDWNKVLAEIRHALAAAARKVLGEIGHALAAFAREELAGVGEELARRRRKAGNTRPSSPIDQRNRCLFWECPKVIQDDHFLCHGHYQDFQSGLIDECLGCGRAKYTEYTEYKVCLDCYRQRRGQGTKLTASRRPRWYKREYASNWAAGDATVKQFYVYILKTNDGNFYAGQTRELRERLSEHRDGRTQSTVGKQPTLVWFTIVDSRDEATTKEAELKKLIATNPREIRRRVVSFQDVVKELGSL